MVQSASTRLEHLDRESEKCSPTFEKELTCWGNADCPCQAPVEPACHHAASRNAVTRVSGKSRRSMAPERVLAERSGRCQTSPRWITDGTAPPMVECPRQWL